MTLLRNKWFLGLVSIAVIFSGFYSSSKIPFSGDLKSFGFENKQDQSQYEEYRSEFSSDETLLTLLLVDEKGIWNFNAFEKIERIISALERDKKVEKVLFLSRIPYPSRRGPIESSRTLFNPEDSANFESELYSLWEYPDITPKFLSRDQKAAAVYVYLNEGVERSDLSALLKRLDDQAEGIKMHVLHLKDRLNSAEMRADQQKVLLIAFVLLILGFYFIFKKFKTVIYLLWNVSLSLSVFYLLAFVLDIQFNVLSMSIPVLMIVLSLSDAVHIAQKTLQEGYTSMKMTFSEIGPALFYTSLTTACGFAVFLFLKSDLILEYALLCLMGITIAFIVSRYLSPFVLPHLFPKQALVKDNLIMSKISALVTTKKGVFIGFGMILLAISSLLSFQHFDSPIKLGDHLEPNSSTSRSFEAYKKHFKQERSFEIYLSSEQDLLQGDLVTRIDQLEKKLLRSGEYRSFNSINTLVKRYNRYKNAGLSSYFKIPNELTEKLIREIEQKQSELGLNNVISENRKLLKITLQGPDHGAKKAIEQEEKLALTLRESLPHHVNIWVGGPNSIAEKGMLRINSTLAIGLGAAVLVIAILFFLLFKSVRYTLAGLFVNLLPLTSVVSLMYISDSPLDPSNLMILSVLIGISVDDTIHFLYTYSRMKKEGFSESHCIENTLKRSGRAIILSSLLLIVGFCSLLFSNYSINRELGLYFTVGVFIALISDILLLPSLLSWARKQK
jgi:uncharacterized protein